MPPLRHMSSGPWACQRFRIRGCKHLRLEEINKIPNQVRFQLGYMSS